MLPCRLPLLALLLACGCSHNVQVPPSRPIALEAPQTVGAGQSRARFQLSTHSMLFNGDFRSGNLRLRTGRTDRLELSADGTIVSVEDASSASTMFLGRVGAKLQLGDSKNIAVFGGVGGGTSEQAGSMVSSDGGISIGFHNRYVVPFLAVSTFMSRPVGAREVRTGSEPDQVDTPTLTAGTSTSVGLAIIRERYSISAGLGSTFMRDEDGDEGVMTAGIAIELALD